jgi:ubiquinone/menaquinone biosynthesis C-methylase UbiE
MVINYTNISKGYDEHRAYSKDLITAIIKLGKIGEDKRILDLGCGTGNVIVGLREFLRADIFGVDISLYMLERSRRKSLQVICADIDGKQLPFRNSSFDIILSAYVIHQINNLPALFSESFRVLRNGSLILLTMSHEQLDHYNPVMEQFFPSAIEVDKARFPDISEIDDMLRVAGFRSIKHQEVIIEKIPLDQRYVQKAKEKYVSTFHLIPQQEFQLGIERLESFIENNRQKGFLEWRGTLLCGEK